MSKHEFRDEIMHVSADHFGVGEDQLRPMRSTRRWTTKPLLIALAALGLLIFAGCNSGLSSQARSERAPDADASVSLPFGLSDCPRPDEGCSCAPGTEPIACNVAGEGSCGEGTRYCRDGAWSACEGIRTFEIRKRNALLAPGFSSCSNACEPDCFVVRDRPHPVDIRHTPEGALPANADPEIHASDDLTDYPGVRLVGASVLNDDWREDIDGDGFADFAESPGCVIPGQSNGMIDSGWPGGTPQFGCPAGDGYGIYAELEPESNAFNAQDTVNIPPKPLDLYFLADRAVTRLRITFLGLFDLGTFTVSFNEPLDALVNESNLAAFDTRIRSAYTSLGAAPDIRYAAGYFQDFQRWVHYGDSGGNARAYEHHTGFTTSYSTLRTAMSNIRGISRSGAGDVEVGSIGSVVGIVNRQVADVYIEIALHYPCLGPICSPIPTGIEKLEFVSPESQALALWSMVTGSGLPYGDRPIPDGPACPDGAWGYPCFRPEALPVALVIMDGAMHHGPVHDYQYNTGRLGSPELPPGWSDIAYVLTSNELRVLGLHGCSAGSLPSFFNCETNSTAFGQLSHITSLTNNGEPGFTVNLGHRPTPDQSRDGVLSVADKINHLVRTARDRVEIIVRDNAATPFDERNFVEGLSLDRPTEYCGGGCEWSPAEKRMVCPSCNALDEINLYTDLTYRPNVEPGLFPPQTNVPQVFDFHIDIARVTLRNGNRHENIIQRIPVRVVIPPDIQLEKGDYWRNYDATVFDPDMPPSTPICEIGGQTGLRPDWREFEWRATTPSSGGRTSYIEFNVFSADDAADLESDPVFCFRVPENAPTRPGCTTRRAAEGSLDIGRYLVDGGGMNFQHLLRMEATLFPSGYPDGDLKVGPTLYEMDVSYACTPFE